MAQHSPASSAYIAACNHEHAPAALELIQAFDNEVRICNLAGRTTPLNDTDLICIAEALRNPHTLRGLDLEGNDFGLLGLQSLIDALASNPGILRELRLGKNKLKDPALVVVGNALSLSGLGIKILDMSENNITKLGAMSVCQALSGRSCDIVELSLHNNQLDADAGISLAQALRTSAKLKHLHLGYNLLKDIGATHLARSLPASSTIVTLDLTANRIGPQGGQELARALTSGTTTIQRLNLRHNLFDDETLQLFADVVLRNTSLTQLFLGFMPASGATATTMLSSLRHNKTLLCLDMFGWQVDPAALSVSVEELLFHNLTLRSLIIDGSDKIQNLVDSANGNRMDRSIHPVYVGGDDVQAAHATSGRGMTVPVAAPTRSTSQVSAVSRPSPAPRRTTNAAPSTSQPSAVASYPAERSLPVTGAVALRTVAQQQQQQNPTTSDVPSEYASCSQDIDVMLRELQRVDFDPQLRNRLLLIISQLQLKIEIQRSYQQQQIVALEERVRVLEQRDASSRHLQREGESMGTARLIRESMPVTSGTATNRSQPTSQSPIPRNEIVVSGSAHRDPSPSSIQNTERTRLGSPPRIAREAAYQSADNTTPTNPPSRVSPSRQRSTAATPANQQVGPSMSRGREVNTSNAATPTAQQQVSPSRSGQPTNNATSQRRTISPSRTSSQQPTYSMAPPGGPTGQRHNMSPSRTGSEQPASNTLAAPAGGPRSRSTEPSPLVKPSAPRADTTATHEPVVSIHEESAPTPDLQTSKPIDSTSLMVASPSQQEPPARPKGARLT